VADVLSVAKKAQPRAGCANGAGRITIALSLFECRFDAYSNADLMPNSDAQHENPSFKCGQQKPSDLDGFS
jgi:hypothetical protein